MYLYFIQWHYTSGALRVGGSRTATLATPETEKRKKKENTPDTALELHLACNFIVSPVSWILLSGDCPFL